MAAKKTPRTPRAAAKRAAAPLAEVCVEVAPVEAALVEAAPVELAPVEVAPVVKVDVVSPPHEAVRALAQQIWERDGGRAFDNWLAAERQLSQTAASPA